MDENIDVGRALLPSDPPPMDTAEEEDMDLDDNDEYEGNDNDNSITPDINNSFSEEEIVIRDNNLKRILAPRLPPGPPSTSTPTSTAPSFSMPPPPTPTPPPAPASSTMPPPPTRAQVRDGRESLDSSQGSSSSPHIMQALANHLRLTGRLDGPRVGERGGEKEARSWG